MPASVEHLIADLADRYAIERELGAGGMATVYLAEDVKHHRKVAVKVLRPELAAALGAERFLHEIQVAAKLNHPHIVALYDSGRAGGCLYYVMPVVEGESLRALIDRERRLPIETAVTLTRQIASALHYAHRRGVIHRDIKPENVLVQEGAALVTDFGIALAISKAGDARLTETGLSLGTPYYMSPEQAAGERDIDARSDVYSLGCVMFEMLAGEAPFTGDTAQSVMAKRITEPPPTIAERRDGVPDTLSTTLTTALARAREERFASAAAFADALAGETTSTAPTVRTEPIAAWNHPVAAAAGFGVAAAVILGIVYALMLQLGLPDWVLPSAVGLLVIGLPIVVATAAVERRRIRPTVSPRELHRWFNWRRALIGGGLAFAGLAATTAGFMGLRAMGIGPAATVFTKGFLQERDPILLAEFVNNTSDSTLGPTITAGLRIDLSQSRVVRLVEPAAVADALERMVVDGDTPLNEALARQVAEREGVKAVLAGEVSPVGRGYMLSARLVSPADGAMLAAVRETAHDDTKLIRAIDQLSARLRERIGESLKDVRASPALGRVTTSSLEALRRYTLAVRLDELQGEPVRAVPLLDETVALDSTFAMAYRKLGHLQWNWLGQIEAGMAALTRAFELRHRATERERYNIEAYYYGSVDYDAERLTAAYRATLTLDPDDHVALVNLASHLASTRQWAERESLALRAVEVSGIWQSYANALHSRLMQRKFAEYQVLLDRFAAAHPDDPRERSWRIDLAVATRDFDRAEELLRGLAANRGMVARGAATQRLADLMLLRGRRVEAERWYRTWIETESVFGAVYRLALLRAENGAVDDAIGSLESYPVASRPPVERPYIPLARFYAMVGQSERATDYVERYEEEVPEGLRKRASRRQLWRLARGEIAMAEERWDDAGVEFTLVNALSGACMTCGLARLAHAWERAGRADSALAAYERLVSAPLVGFRDEDIGRVPYAYKRLGELYEARGDTAQAIERYDAFVELWSDADPELQSLIEETRRRIAALAGEPTGSASIR